MLVLNNINCTYIEAKSDQTSDLALNLDEYETVTVEVIKNCCEESIFTDNLDLSNTTWQVNYPTNTDYTVTGLYAKNIVTGEIFNILGETTFPVGSNNCQDGTLIAFQATLEDWFVVNTGVTITQNIIYDPILNTCVYDISDLPDNFVMVNLEKVMDNITLSDEFMLSQGNFTFINGTSIYIPLSVVSDVSKFPNDGVYKVRITYKKPDCSEIVEENCTFVDCEIKCLVGKEVKDLLDIKNDDINIFLLHYTLTETSNCNCNCDALCEIYEELYNRLCENKDCTNCGC